MLQKTELALLSSTQGDPRNMQKENFHELALCYIFREEMQHSVPCTLFKGSGYLVSRLLDEEFSTLSLSQEEAPKTELHAEQELLQWPLHACVIVTLILVA